MGPAEGAPESAGGTLAPAGGTLSPTGGTPSPTGGTGGALVAPGEALGPADGTLGPVGGTPESVAGTFELAGGVVGTLGVDTGFGGDGGSSRTMSLEKVFLKRSPSSCFRPFETTLLSFFCLRITFFAMGFRTEVGERDAGTGDRLDEAGIGLGGEGEGP